MSNALRHVVQLLKVVAVCGVAAAAGWMAGWWQQKGSLMNTPASAPASLEKTAGFVEMPTEPEPVIEAETAVKSVQSASDGMLNDIRPDGHAAAAMGGAANGKNDELLDLVTRESQLVMGRLAEEVSVLRKDLDEQVMRSRRLSEALAEAQAALDVKEMQRAQSAGQTPAPVLDAPVEAYITDVNMELGLVVLDQGVRQGMRYGLPLTVMRDRRRVARIRVVDVREGIAGAVIDEMARGEIPQKGDRAVLIRTDGP